jgi:hypothetical protein
MAVSTVARAREMMLQEFPGTRVSKGKRVTKPYTGWRFSVKHGNSSKAYIVAEQKIGGSYIIPA